LKVQAQLYVRRSTVTTSDKKQRFNRKNRERANKLLHVHAVISNIMTHEKAKWTRIGSNMNMNYF